MRCRNLLSKQLPRNQWRAKRAMVLHTGKEPHWVVLRSSQRRSCRPADLHWDPIRTPERIPHHQGTTNHMDGMSSAAAGPFCVHAHTRICVCVCVRRGQRQLHASPQLSPLQTSSQSEVEDGGTCRHLNLTGRRARAYRSLSRTLELAWAGAAHASDFELVPRHPGKTKARVSLQSCQVNMSTSSPLSLQPQRAKQYRDSTRTAAGPAESRLRGLGGCARSSC